MMPSKKSNPSFRCIHCGYDLSDLRGTSGNIVCLKCNNETDPYNPLATHVKKQSLHGVFIRSFAAALLPGAALGLAISASLFLIFIVGLTLLLPALACDIIVKRAVLLKRPWIKLTIGIGVLTGFIVGLVLYFIIVF